MFDLLLQPNNLVARIIVRGFLGLQRGNDSRHSAYLRRSSRDLIARRLAIDAAFEPYKPNDDSDSRKAERNEVARFEGHPTFQSVPSL
jgi:hypothetical protein